MQANNDGPQTYLAKVWENLDRLYSGEELRTLSFAIGVDYDDLETTSLSARAKARELVLYLDRRGRLAELVERCQHERPDADWHDSTAMAAVSVVLYTQSGVIAAPPQLFGRGQELAEATAQLGQAKRVLLVGLAGIGKTAIAATLADQHLQNSGGSVIWLQAGQADADSILEAIAGCLGKKQAVMGQLGDARVLAVRKVLEDANKTGTTFVILDDVWNAGALRRVLKAVPSPLRVLVTSRQRLPWLDVIIEVGDLKPDSALKLLGHHAGQDFTTNIFAAKLCQKLGYHAYELEIAGATLKVDESTPQALLARIVESPEELEMPFGEITNMSMSRLLDGSFTALDESSQETFIALGGFFAPEITPEILSSYLKLDVQATTNALRVLAQRTLVKAQKSGFFTMHDLTFSYAQAKFADNKRDRQQIVAAVESYVTAHAQDFDGLEANMPHVLGAAGAAVDKAISVRIMSIVTIGNYPTPEEESYFGARGHTLPLLEQLGEAIEIAREEGSIMRETLHFLLSKQGNAMVDRRYLDKAIESYKEAFQLSPSLNRQVTLLAVIGQTLAEQGRDDESENMLQQAFDMARLHGDTHAMSFVLEHRSMQAGRNGKYQEARDFAHEAVVINKLLSDPIRLGFSLVNLGTAERDLGDPNKALELHHQAFDIAENGEHRQLRAWVFLSLAEDYHAISNHLQAHHFAIQAWSLATKIGDSDAEEQSVTFMDRNNYVKPNLQITSS